MQIKARRRHYRGTGPTGTTGLMCLDSELCDMQIAKFLFPQQKELLCFQKCLKIISKEFEYCFKIYWDL